MTPPESPTSTSPDLETLTDQDLIARLDVWQRAVHPDGEAYRALRAEALRRGLLPTSDGGRR